jgi:hypothetical protein
MSNDLLIDRLSAQLKPVARRDARRDGVVLAMVGLVELSLILGLGMARPDMGQAIAHGFLWWKLGSLAILAAIGGLTAVRSFAPTASPRSGLLLAVGVATAAVFGGAFVDPVQAVGGTLVERLMPVHGILCALCIMILSLPMLAGLGVLMRRGAPTHPEQTALAIGTAAGSWGAFVFAFCCPVNDPLYVVIWYLIGCGTVVAAARLLLPRRFTL